MRILGEDEQQRAFARVPRDAAGERVPEQRGRSRIFEQGQVALAFPDGQTIRAGEPFGQDRPQVAIDLGEALRQRRKKSASVRTIASKSAPARTVATAGCPVRSEISPTVPRARCARRAGRFRPGPRSRRRRFRTARCRSPSCGRPRRRPSRPAGTPWIPGSRGRGRASPEASPRRWTDGRRVFFEAGVRESRSNASSDTR